MIYTKLTKLATNIAFVAHKYQTGKDGLPYICHPLHVAEQMDDETSTCVALLHDVIEDTQMTAATLKAEGIPDYIIDHVLALTRNKDEKYFNYIERVAADRVATKVKLADLEHNLDEKRLDDGLPKSLKKRYEKARIRLLEPPSDIAQKFGMRPQYTASDIAAHIINHASNYHLNNLKLQKLLYMCQRQYLQEHKVPLFADKIEAWAYGPVVPCVYNVYSYRGASHLHKAHACAMDPNQPARPVNLTELDAETAQMVDSICTRWSENSAFDLINHINAPTGAWYAVYQPNSDHPRFGEEITLDIIMNDPI